MSSPEVLDLDLWYLKKDCKEKRRGPKCSPGTDVTRRKPGLCRMLDSSTGFAGELPVSSLVKEMLLSDSGQWCAEKGCSARMETFIQGKDYELWDRITDGPTIPIKLEDGKHVKKVRSEFTLDDLLALKKNAKAKNILVCGLGPAEYNRVSTCTTAKQIWDALVNAHEGTSQVTAIREANKDLAGMTLDKLVGNLRTYEMEINGTKMVKAWGFDLDDDEVDETALIALGDSDLKEEDDASEENCSLKKQVEQLDSSNNDLKSKVLKLTLSEKRKNTKSKEQEKVELELVKYKGECHNATEMMNKLSQEVSKLKLDLERANRWTNSSRIVHKLSETYHSEKTGLGFHKSLDVYPDLCYICENLGHPTTECPVAVKSRSSNLNLANKLSQIKKMVTKISQRNGSCNLLPVWARKNLIHSFTYKKGPKLVWVPKVNP
ncbi:hypothetical protein FXO37_04662 [Capsicum annuum]|nr:hypothetical protein FXO37_04662 [Capsicum annuum]